MWWCTSIGDADFLRKMLCSRTFVFVQELKRSFLFQPFGACKRWVGICLFCMRGWQEIWNPDLFISGVNKRTVFVWSLCITATSMLWSQCICTPDRGRGGGSRLSRCLVSWRTGWGKMCVGKYFLCASLSSRGLLTSVPVAYGAVQRSWTQVSNCEYSSERPLKKRRGNWKQS